MPDFICPVCRNKLIQDGKTLKCEKNHSYDISRHGYVNLLMSNVSSLKRHGDDKAMVRARQLFLDRGYYIPLCCELEKLAIKYSDASVSLLDVGCGECWYTSSIRKALENSGKHICAVGIDISKYALMAAHARDDAIRTAVASVSSLPIKDNSCDIILNVFAPLNELEFFRVLKPAGILIRVVPMEKHLWGLKCAVYDTPYENPSVEAEISGFEVIETSQIKYKITVAPHEDIAALFMMTPYYYKTGASDQAKLNKLTSLDTDIEFDIIVYKKK